MQRIFSSYPTALLHQYTNLFCDRANNPKLQNMLDTQDFWLAHNIFHNILCAYAFMPYHISSLISASLPIIK